MRPCKRSARIANRFWFSDMLHLIGLNPKDEAGINTLKALYVPEDVCVFTDAGLLLAGSFPIQGRAYCLKHPSLSLPDSPYEEIGHSALLELVAEHGTCTSWY